MKSRILFLSLLPALLPAAGCEALMGGSSFSSGNLQIRFEQNALPVTRAVSIPDTNDFILNVTGSDGRCVYSGNYGGVRENLPLEEGTYTVSALSREFSTPEFDAPQYGDTQVAVIQGGRTTVVTLNCVQMNAGVRLTSADSFAAAYPDAVLYLKSSAGRLMYSRSERRTAYFQPGAVSLLMSDRGTEKILLTKVLEAQQMLTLNVSTGKGAQASGGVEIQIDTARYWIYDSVLVDGGGDTQQGGNGRDGAYSVGVAKTHAGEDDVWVYGYIVGGDLSSSKCSFKAPFSSRTNLVLASKSSCTDKSQCLSVQLAKGEIRDALNLVDHPELVGRQIFLRGDIVPSYYGIPGIQNISEYEYK